MVNHSQILVDLPSILFIEDLSKVIGKAPTTIRTCATNIAYQHLIPRPFRMPGSRRLSWDKASVLAWLNNSEQVTAKRGPGRPKKTRTTPLKG